MTHFEFFNQNLELSKEEQKAILDSLVTLSFSKNQTIHHIDHIHNKALFIESGVARGYYIDENGHDTTWYIYFNDSSSHMTNLFVFDYDSYINQTPSNLCFEAIADCTFSVVEKSTIDHLCSTSLKWSEFSRNLSNMAYSLVHKKYFTQLVLSAEERFDDFLKNTPFLLDKVPQYHIASYLGITPQHLSRLKKNLK